MAIPDEFLAELRGRVDIVDVIGGYVRLKKAGSSFRALCPFHKEKTPSFMVSPERGIYKCFGCGASGNVITFVMETQKVGFVEAVKTLASRVGMEVPALRGAPCEEGRNEGLYEALEFATQQFERRLWDSQRGDLAKRYLVERGISVDTAKAFRLGYADSSGAFLVAKSRGLGVWDGLVEAGTVIQGRGAMRDMFRHRLIFPILNASGRVVGFGGRSLDGTEPKYLNSSESAVFSKGSLLYGLTQAKRGFREAGRAILVEGYMDVLALHQAGLSNAVASAGTALTERQASMLKRYTDSVVIAFDGDEAGQRAARRSLEVLVGAGLDAMVAPLTEGADPDSVVREGGSAAFLKVLGGAMDAISFISSGLDSDKMPDREAAIRRVVVLLDVVPDPIRRQVLTQRASDVLGVPENVLMDGVKTLRRGGMRERAEAPADRVTEGIPPLERELLRALLLAPELTGEVVDAFDPSLLRHPESRRLFNILAEGWRLHGPATPAELMDRTDDPAMRAVIGEVTLQWEGSEFDAAKAVHDCVRRLRERGLRGRLETIKTEIRRKEATGLHDEVGELAVQLQGITDQLKALAQGAL